MGRYWAHFVLHVVLGVHIIWHTIRSLGHFLFTPKCKEKMQLAAAISILRPASPNDAPVVWQMNRFYWLSSIWNLHHKIFIFIPRAPPRIPPSLVERPTRVERQISWRNHYVKFFCNKVKHRSIFRWHHDISSGHACIVFRPARILLEKLWWNIRSGPATKFPRLEINFRMSEMLRRNKWIWAKLLATGWNHCPRLSMLVDSYQTWRDGRGVGKQHTDCPSN